MRILHLINSGGMYGAEVMILTLVKEQKKQGLLPTIGIISTAEEHPKPLLIACQDAGVSYHSFIMKAGYSNRGVREILLYLQREGVSVVHNHGYKANILMGVTSSRCRRGARLVSTVHGWTATSGFSRIAVYESLDRLILRRADSVVVVSRSMLADPRLRSISPEKLHYIPNGISHEYDELSLLDPILRSFCNQSFIIGCIGRLSVEKAHRCLLEALHILCCQGIDVKLLLFGDGPEMGGLQELVVELNLDDRVLFAGFKKDAAAYMKLMNVFVLPSLTEGSPIVLLEAMRSGIPIVATNVGGIPDMLTDQVSALLVDSGSKVSLAEGIKRIIDDPELASRIGAEGKIAFLRDFTDTNMAARYQLVYLERQVNTGELF